MKKFYFIAALALSLAASFAYPKGQNLTLTPVDPDGDKNFELIVPAAPVWDGSEDCQDGEVGAAPTCTTVSAVTGNYAPKCVVAGGNLPSGVWLNEDCTYGGSFSAEGSFSWTVFATNSEGVVESASHSVTVTAPAAGIGLNCTAAEIAANTYGQGTSISVSFPTYNGTNAYSWAFTSGDDGAAACGRFANGDYWIAPRAGQTTVKIVSSTGTGGSGYAVDENPQIESQGLLNLGPYYVASENVLGDFPKEYSAPVSVIGAIQRQTQRGGDTSDTCWGSAGSGNYTCFDSIMRLTVLDAIPPGGGKGYLPPPVDEATKVMTPITEVVTSRLLGFNSADYSAATDAEYEAQRVRWSHQLPNLSMLTKTGVLPTEGGRAFTSTGLTSSIGYAASIAQMFFNDLSHHWSSADSCSSEACLQALYAKVVYGQDYFWATFKQTQTTPGLYDRERYLGSGAGQANGRLGAMVLYTALMQDPELRATSATLASLVDTVTPGGEPAGPHELEQLNVNPSTGVVVWGDTEGNGTHAYYAANPINIATYWENMRVSLCYDGASGTCNPNAGSKNQTDPTRQIDGPANKPGTSYMQVSAGPTEALATLALNMQTACEAIGYPALITYVDRINQKGVRVGPDTCAPIDPNESASCDMYPTPSGCLYYGLQFSTVPTYGPTSTSAYNTCHSNNSGSNTGQTGRFSNLATVEGNFYPLNFGYVSNEIHVAWSNTRARIGVTCSGL